MTIDFSQLRKLSELKALKNSLRFQELRSRETRIRQEIVNLHALRKASQSTNTDLIQMRAIGADLLWQGWLSQKISQKNSEVAQMNALLEPYREMARLDLGRKEATKRLEAQAQDANRKRLMASKLDRAIEQFTYRARR